MIVAHASKATRRMQVFVNGSPRKRVLSVWALWNGGPGVIKYMVIDVNGSVFLDDPGRDLAIAYKLCRSVTLKPMEQSE